MSSSHSNGHFPMNLPILTGKNYDNWCKQMKVILCFQGFWDLVKYGLEHLDEDPSDEEETEHRELGKKNYKALSIIHQCVSPKNLKR